MGEPQRKADKRACQNDAKATCETSAGNASMDAEIARGASTSHASAGAKTYNPCSSHARTNVYRVGEPVAFDGYVDDFEYRIAAIQFSLDNGASWTTYETAGTVAEKGVNWHFVYTPTQPGRYLLKARAVDGKGTAAALVENYTFEVQA